MLVDQARAIGRQDSERNFLEFWIDRLIAVPDFTLVRIDLQKKDVAATTEALLDLVLIVWIYGFRLVDHLTGLCHLFAGVELWGRDARPVEHA